jgi:hypothetical protein
MASNSFKVKNSLNLTPQASEPSGLEVGDLWADLNGKIYRYDGSGSKEIGSSQGGINYITNPDFESNDAGWVEYLDNTSSAVPVDGVGAGATITFNRSVSSPLRGTASGLLVKPASNERGEGVSYDFTIDSADQAKVLEVSFDYTVTANYVDGDIRVYVYDITNATVIELSQRDLLANSGQATYRGFFQAASNSTSYRLIYHIATTSALAYDLKIDNVKVGPAQAIEGGNVSVTSLYRSAAQTGVNPNNSHVKINLDNIVINTAGGADIANNQFVAPESGYYFAQGNVAILATNVLNNQYISFIFINNGAAAIRGQSVVPQASQTFTSLVSGTLYLNKGDTLDLRIYGAGNNSVNTLIATGPSTLERNFLNVTKIASDQASAGSSVVAFRAFLSSAANHTVNGSYQKVPINSVEFDTSGAWDISTTRWNCPESGYYNMLGQVTFSSVTAGKEIISAIRVNNAAVAVGNIFATGATTFVVSTASCIKFLNKGDYVELFAYQNDSTSEAYATGAPSTSFSISKLSSPAIIPPTEFVGCRYFTDAGQAVTDATTIIFEDREYDSHNAYDTLTGNYIIPVSGYYQIECSIATQSVTPGAATQFIGLNFRNNNIASTNRVGLQFAASTSARSFSVNGSTTLYFNKGEVLQIKFYETLPAVNLTSSGSENAFTITKVG